MWCSTNFFVNPFFRQHIVWKSRRKIKQRRRRRRREGHGGGSRGGGGLDSSGGRSGRWRGECKSILIFIVYFILFNSDHLFRQQFDRGKRRRRRRRGRCDDADQLQPRQSTCIFIPHPLLRNLCWKKLTFPFCPSFIIWWHGRIGRGGGRGSGAAEWKAGAQQRRIRKHVSLIICCVCILFTSFFNSNVF